EGMESIEFFNTDGSSIGRDPFQNFADSLENVSAGSRIRLPLNVRIGPGEKAFTLKLKATTSTGLSDTLTRTVAIAPKGFPISIHHGGMLESGNPHSFTV